MLVSSNGPEIGLAQKPRLHDNWREIEYPSVLVKWDAIEDQIHVTVRNRREGEADKLKVILSCGRGQSDTKGLIDPAQIEVFLHRASSKNKVTATVDELRFWMGLGGSLGVTYSLYYDFPWGPNVLEEGWIELRLPGQVYWVELPYGFTRNPADPLTPVESKSGRPAFASAMKKMGETDRILPWLHVHYDLGKIQNHWRLSVNLSNPFNAEAEVILYHKHSLDLHSPRTAIEIRQPGGRALRSACWSIRELDGLMSRCDSFRFATNPAGDHRCWGTAIVKVDDKSYEWPVPSSLFKYTHGTSDPYHKALVPRKSGR